MNKEQIEKLAKFITDQLHIGHTPRFSLKSWFEQHPQEPVVVGLSDEQKDGILKLFAYDSDEYMEYAEKLRNYLKTQTFTQSVELHDEIKRLEGLNKTLHDCIEDLLAKFEQEQS